MEKHGKRSHTNESQATKSQIKREWEDKDVSDTVCDNYDPEIGFPTGNGKCKNCGKYHEE